MKFKQGDVVFIKDILAPITIMYEHSGYYDSQYTGSDPKVMYSISTMRM